MINKWSLAAWEYQIINSLPKYRPRHAKTFLWAYAGSEGPDQPAHLRIIGYYGMYEARAKTRMITMRRMI